MIQGIATEASPSNRLLNGEFASSDDWTLGAGWTIAGGKLVATNISGTSANSGSLGLTVGKLYLVEMAVVVTSPGSAGAGEGWLALINDNYLQLPDDIALGLGYNQSLTASWLYSPTAINSDYFLFSCNESTIDFEVDYVRVFEVSMPGIALYSGNTLVDNITSFSGDNFLKYYFQGELFMNNGSLIGGITNILYETETDLTSDGVPVMWEMYIETWDSVTSETGCLTARFYDTVFLTDRIRNGIFDGNLDWWTAGSGWTYSSGKACYSSIGGITSLTQTVILTGGVRHLLSLSVSGATGNESVNVFYTINGGAPIQATAAFVYIIDLTSETTELITVEIQIQVATSSDTLCVDDISLVAESPDDFNTTNCINIQSEHPCTILLYAINFDNAFGLDYTTGSLQQWLRVYGKIKYNDYPEEAEVFKFSDNSHQIMFASSEKEYEVIIGDAPEQIHDCIAILRLHDIFQIDGYSFVRSGNYDLNRRRSSDNSQAIFTVKEQDGVSSNYSCQ